MSTPAAGSPGDNKAFLDGAAVTFPVVIDATHNQVEFNEQEYVIPEYLSARTSSALTLPVTITAASNDQFEFNELEYIIPAGVYDNASKLATAINAATNDEDNVGATFESAVLVSAPDRHHLRFESVGASVLAFGTGAEHDALASIGLSDANALAAVGYPDIRTLCAALNASIQSGDSSRLDAVVKATPSPFTPNAIRLTRVVTGADTKTVGTGASNDAAARLGFTDAAALAGGATAINTGVTLDSGLTSDQVPDSAPPITGNGVAASVVSDSAPSYPVTITAASNDQFEFNELEYLIPAGVYANARQLARAINASANDEDNAGATFASVVVVQPLGNGTLRAVARASGANTGAFGTGAEHDGLASIGWNDGTALAGGS